MFFELCEASRRRAAAWSVVAALSAAAAAAQSVVTELVPEDGVASVERLGFAAAEALVVGAELEPGDLVESLAPGVLVELNCPPESASFVTLEAPFRVLVDVAEGPSCHVDLLAGGAEILSEEPTAVTSGGVQMTSVGTVFAVRVERVDEAVEQSVLVYEGEVDVRSESGVERVAKGLARAYRGRRAVGAARAISADERRRSSAVYSNLDLARALRAGVEVGDRQEAFERLRELHRRVLEAPEDEDRRVELVRTQLGYRASNRALYHLKKAGADDPERAEALGLDLSVLESGLTAKNRDYLRRRLASGLSGTPGSFPGARPSPGSSGRTAETGSAADRALEMLRGGQAREAAEAVERHLKQPGVEPGSRDHLALALAFDKLGRSRRAVAEAETALELHGRDGALSDREARALERLLDRLR